jgi:hypothetical protein
MTTATLSFSKTEISFPEMPWKVICIAGFLISLALLIFYVWQIDSLTKGSYLINSYQKQISQLSQENKNLQVSFAENSFLGQAMEKIQALNFQKTTSVQYIQIPDVSVGYNYKNNVR